jgi:hypothetical protein
MLQTEISLSEPYFSLCLLLLYICHMVFIYSRVDSIFNDFGHVVSCISLRYISD